MFALRKDGREFPVEVGLAPVETEDGLAVICGVLDISERRAALEAMRTARPKWMYGWLNATW